MSAFRNNLFAALDSDDESPSNSKKQTKPKKSSSTNTATKSTKENRGNKKNGNSKTTSQRGQRRGGKKDGSSTSSWSGPSGGSSFDARGDRKKSRARNGAGDRKKKTRDLRNGYGKGPKATGPKKGGGGAHNWGKAGEEDGEATSKFDDETAEAQAVEEQEPEAETFTYEQFQAMKLEKRKNDEAFAARQKVKVQELDGKVYKKKASEDHIYVSHHKAHGRAGHNRNNKKFGDAAKFFRPAPIRERSDERPRGGDRGDRRSGRGGRGGGRGGRGGRNNEKSNRRQRPVNLTNSKDFPSLC